MRKDPFLNFGFLMLVLIFFTVQHSTTLLGLAAQNGTLSGSEDSQRSEFIRDAAAHAPATVNRATELLNQTWRRVKIFDEWVMEYNTSQWELFRASNPAESDLLRARFYVANAEVFTEAVSENTRAIRELTRAESSLLAAQPLVGPNLTPQLKSIEQEITAAESNERTSSASSAVPFETIKADLDRLIEMLRFSKT